MNQSHSALLTISKKISANARLSPKELSSILDFSIPEKNSTIIELLKKWAVPLSLALGVLMAMYADWFELFVSRLPASTNLSPRLLSGADYLWGILSQPHVTVFDPTDIVLKAITVAAAKQ